MVKEAKVNVEQPYEVGKPYLIRTVTNYYTGKLVGVGSKELILVDAAWIADTGRFSQAVVSAEFSEVEPYPDGVRVVVGRGAVLDAVVISKLPRIQK